MINDKRQRTYDKRERTFDFRPSTFDFKPKKNEKTSIDNNISVAISLVPKHQGGEPQSRHRVYSPTAVRQRDDRPADGNSYEPRHRVRRPPTNRIPLQAKNRHLASLSYRHDMHHNSRKQVDRKGRKTTMSDDWVGGSGGGSGRQNNSKKRTPVMKKNIFLSTKRKFYAKYQKDCVYLQFQTEKLTYNNILICKEIQLFLI